MGLLDLTFELRRGFTLLSTWKNVVGELCSGVRAGDVVRRWLSMGHYSGLQLNLIAFSSEMLGKRKNQRDAKWNERR